MQNRILEKSIHRKNNFLSFWFAFSFVLNGYASGIPGISLGSVVFIILVLYSIVHSKNKKISSGAIYLLMIFLFISIIDYSVVQNSLDFMSICIGISKYFVWAFMITFGSSVVFHKDTLLSWMVKISLILLLYLIIQNVFFYGFSVYLPNIIEFGPFRAYDSGYVDERFKDTFIIRPASFLSESSFLGGYFTCTLIMLLSEIQKEYSKKMFRFALLISLGIVLTSSTSSITQLPIIWFLLGSNSYRHHKLLSTFLLIAVVGVTLAIWNIFSSLEDSNNALLYSLFYAFNKFDNLENSTRFGNSYAFLNYIPEYLRVLGVGIGNEVKFLKEVVTSNHYYMNSVTMLLVQLGGVGFLLFSIFLMNMFSISVKLKEQASIVLILLYFIHGFSGGMWIGTYGILFLFVANGYLINSKNKRKQLCHTY